MVEQKYFQKISDLLSVPLKSVQNTIELLDEGATIPFISRYRKELTGSMDEVQVAGIRDEVTRLRELDKRREAIVKSIKEQGKLTDELEKKIEEAETMAKLEDLYLPYKPKRRTKATIAKEKGLEPLATLLFAQEKIDVDSEAGKFINEEKEVKNLEEALAGARDIIAEWISEDAAAREKMRTLFKEKGIVTSKVMSGKEQEGEKFKDYFEWTEPLATVPSHRLLAMRRGEKEGFLMMDINPDKEEAIGLLEGVFVKGNNEASKQVKLAVEDSYKRLLKPSIETETRLMSKKQADEKAIQVFAQNLRELLLASPLGQVSILAVDPGFRTGCKVVALDKQGKLLEETVIYPNEPQKKVRDAEMIVLAFCQKHNIEAIAIGNGTASRETESFIRSIEILPKEIHVIVVNESGASVYSASDVAREEFPDYDVTVRGAVSIGRRLADPLAELVKIDPKSIGVGQYQHDVDQTQLKNSLDDVVMSCVNGVGVEVNTASKQLLTYVSGLGPTLAENIVKFRNENGPFKSRKELLKVPRMGDKVFEQAAGFLRIRNSEHPLDASAVHPETYPIVEAMAKDLGAEISDLLKSKDLRKKIDLKKYVTETVGLPTLNDIMQELDKPGRDPRKSFEVFKFQDGVEKIEDLRVGMKLPGIVTNVTNFGAFVDIGVHQDGLVHVSHISNQFVKDPNDVVKVQQKVMVTVLEVDPGRKRISLSMKDNAQAVPKGDRKSSPAVKKEKEPQDVNDMLAALKTKWKS